MVDAKAMEQSGSVVASSRKAGKATLVIASAMSGVTDQLSAAVRGAVVINPLGFSGTNYEAVFGNIAQRTHELIEKAVEPNRTGFYTRWLMTR